MLGLTLHTLIFTLAGPASAPPADEAGRDAPPPSAAEAPATTPADAPQPSPAETDPATAGQEPTPPGGPTDMSVRKSGVSKPDLSDPFAGRGAAEPKSELKDPMERPAPASAPASPSGPTVRKRMRKRDWPDRPIRWRLDLSFDAGSTVVFDEAYLGFDDNRSMPGFRFGFRGDARLGKGRVFLGGGAAYQRYSTDGAVYESALLTDVRIQEPTGLVRLSIMTIEGVDVFVEGAGGPTIVNTEVSATQSASQRTISGFGSGMAGATAYLPKRWLLRKGSSRVTAGIEFGIGYTFRPALDITPDPDVDADETIDTTTAAFGDVFMRGLSWRLGLFVRFM